MKIDWKQKLTSRKLWMAVVKAISLMCMMIASFITAWSLIAATSSRQAHSRST